MYKQETKYQWGLKVYFSEILNRYHCFVELASNKFENMSAQSQMLRSCYNFLLFILLFPCYFSFHDVYDHFSLLYLVIHILRTIYSSSLGMLFSTFLYPSGYKYQILQGFFPRSVLENFQVYLSHSKDKRSCFPRNIVNLTFSFYRIIHILL